MKPVRRTKSRTLPEIAEPDPTATTSAVAATTEPPPPPALVCTRATQHVVQLSRAGRGGQEAEAIDAGAVELGRVRTSSMRVRSAACAALRVAATVPVVIPSASPIAA